MGKEFSCSVGKTPAVAVELGTSPVAPGDNGAGLVDGTCTDCNYIWGEERKKYQGKRHVRIRDGQIVYCTDTEDE